MHYTGTFHDLLNPVGEFICVELPGLDDTPKSTNETTDTLKTAENT